MLGEDVLYTSKKQLTTCRNGSVTWGGALWDKNEWIRNKQVRIRDGEEEPEVCQHSNVRRPTKPMSKLCDDIIRDMRKGGSAVDPKVLERMEEVSRHLQITGDVAKPERKQ